jgi:hypothetical protein
MKLLNFLLRPIAKAFVPIFLGELQPELKLSIRKEVSKEIDFVTKSLAGLEAQYKANITSFTDSTVVSLKAQYNDLKDSVFSDLSQFTAIVNPLLAQKETFELLIDEATQVLNAGEDFKKEAENFRALLEEAKSLQPQLDELRSLVERGESLRASLSRIPGVRL